MLDSTSLANLRSLEERIELFANNVDQNVGLLRRAIQQNRETMVGVINEQRDVNNARFEAATKDLSGLASAVAQTESELTRVKEESEGRDEELGLGINELSASVFAAISAVGVAFLIIGGREVERRSGAKRVGDELTTQSDSELSLRAYELDVRAR